MAVATSTALLVAAGAAMVGAGVSAYGQMQQAKTAAQAGEYNAKLAESEAIQTEIDSRENIRRARQDNRRFRGAQRAAMAKAGGVLGEGSPLLIEAETAGMLELGIQDQRRQAQMEAKRLRAQGAMGLWSARRESQAYKLGAAATLFSGASQAVGSYAMRR